MRVGWLGGTFDPPHLGHLAVARAAVKSFRLDRLLMGPTGRQPLKAKPPVASFADRLAMVQLLCTGEEAVEASALDAPREDGSANYTIDVLRTLQAQLGHSGELFAVAGADAFLDLRRWREPDELLAAAEWIVVSRPGFSLGDLAHLQLSTAQRKRVHLLKDVHVPVSATEVRRELDDGECGEWLIPPPVLSFIRAHQLYGAK